MCPRKHISGQNLAVFLAKNLDFEGKKQIFGRNITEKPPTHLVRIVLWSGVGSNGPKMPIFGQKGPKMLIFGHFEPKILILTGGSFGIHITENHLGTLFSLFFGRPRDQMGQKIPIFGQKFRFWAKFCRFRAKNHNIYGSEQNFGTHLVENRLGILFPLFFGQAWDQMEQKCQYLAKNTGFWPNLVVFGPKIHFFGMRE